MMLKKYYLHLEEMNQKSLEMTLTCYLYAETKSHEVLQKSKRNILEWNCWLMKKLKTDETKADLNLKQMKIVNYQAIMERMARKSCLGAILVYSTKQLDTLNSNIPV